MSEADTPSAAVIATIRQDAERWGTDCGMGLHPLDAKRTRSKGCGGCMAETGSAILAAGDGTAGAPQPAERGAHPFWPGDRAMHGTGSAAVAQKKNHPNLRFSHPTQYARACGAGRCGKGHSQDGIAGRAGRGCSGGNGVLGELGDLPFVPALYGASTAFKNAYGGVAFFGGMKKPKGKRQ